MAEAASNAVFSPSKRPSRGILKNSASIDRQNEGKIATFDEMNILATYHPENKDYGLMKIDEPKTPYAKPSRSRPCSQCLATKEQGSVACSSQEECRHDESANSSDEQDNSHDTNVPSDTHVHITAALERLDADSSEQGSSHDMRRFRRSSFDKTCIGAESSESEDENLTEEEKAHRRVFEERRKMHYNEYMSVRLARQLIDKDDDDNDDEIEADDEARPSQSKAAGDDEDDVQAADEDVAMCDTETAGGDAHVRESEARIDHDENF